MTREQARTYLKCSGMSEEQIDTVEKAFTGVIEDIKAEIKSNMESSIGIYGKDTPLSERAYVKLERNNARNECLQIIDKHIGGK